MANNVTLNFSNINSNGVPCKDPIIIITGKTGDIAFPCGKNIDKDGNIKLSIPDGLFSNKCINFVVKCNLCDSCPEKSGTACLCDTNDDCPSGCSQCIQGVCVSVCADDEVCRDNKCCQCSVDTECKNNFKCDGCKCVCRGFIDASGYCVECLGDQNCSNCESCNNGNCIPKECPNNLICLGSECGCVPGTKYDIVSDSCIPIGCENDGQCDGPCSICVSGQCQEIQCPEGYKCVDGTCIFWPCDNVSCQNGGDCGKNCGCLNGECVPCYLLECTGECAQALGCKCTNGVCGPVDNCGEYCDGSTPCLGNSCTCYNNRCVSCENFPCPDDCANHYNCGCSETNTCEGGKACTDDLKLTKKQDCSLPTGCELLAEFETKTGCNCDPIEFRIKNVLTCNSQGKLVGPVMNLQVAAFKNNIPYTDYLNQLSIGDDELVNATLKTTITFQKLNSAGVWVNEVVDNALPVSDVIVAGNQNANIVLSLQNFGLNNAGDLIPRRNSRRANIEVRIVDVEIPNNGCVLYGDKVLNNYTLDLQAVGLCAQLASYQEEKSVKLNDNESQRRPLFIWSRSNTNTFAGTKFKTDGVYAQSGWFRKEYGEKVGNKWVDKINTPEQGLVNNYNYKVQVDCGCKANVSILQKVIFCCPQDWKSLYTITNCGRTITVNPFSACLVNRKLDSGFPQEVQTVYYMKVNGEDKVLRVEGGNLLNAYTYTHTNPITSLEFSQRYAGNPIVAKACEYTYAETPDVPDFDVSTECGKIIVTKRAGTPTISNVTFTGFNGNFVPTQSNTVWTATVPTISETYQVTTYFQGSCVYTKEVQVICQPVVEATPTDIYAKAECPSGTNPNIVVSVVSGFTGAAEFQDPRTGLWSAADSTSPVIKKTFTNFPAGQYTFNVRETGKPSANDTTTILPTIKPTIITTNICGNTSGSITLTGGAPNSQWRISGPAFPTGQLLQLDNTGNGTTSIPFSSAAGQYFVQFVSDATGSTCAVTETVTITKDGGTITPTISTGGIQGACQGNDILFKIIDNGVGLTYNITSSGGTLLDIVTEQPINQLQAVNNGAYNAKIRVINSGTNSVSITISSTAAPSCYVVVPITKLLDGIEGPVIINKGATCAHPNQYDAFVTITGPVTSVTIDGHAATQVGNTWSVFGRPTPPLLEATIAASTFTCSITDILDIPNCDPQNFCPPVQPVNIASIPASPTCGGENVSVVFNSTGLGVIEGLEYQWVEVIGGVDFALMSGTIDSSTMLPNVNGVPNLEVFSGNTPKYYRLSIISNGVCINNSDLIEIVAGSNITPVITGLTTGVMTGQSYNYSTQSIPGATYVWTLSNTNGSNQPVGTNSSSVVISTFAPGNNTINVTVTSGACSGSASLVVTADLSCPQSITIQPVAGVGDTSCRNLTYTINNGTSITSHRWLVDGISYQSGGAVIANLNLTNIPAGGIVDIVLEVTFANGCIVESTEYEYTRCSCICGSNNVCTQEFELSGTNSFGTYDAVTLPTGKDIKVSMTDFGVADRFIVKYNGVTLVDTGYIGNVGHACAISNSLPYLITTPPMVGTNISADIISGGGVVAGGIAVMREAEQLQSFTYTTAAEGLLQLIHNDALCSGQGAWKFTVECV